MRYSAIISVMLVFLLLASCASQDFNKIKKYETAAIPIINVNPHIDYSNVQDGAIMEQESRAKVIAQAAGAVQQAADDESFDFFKRIAINLRDRTYKDFSNKLGVRVQEEYKVINSPAYKNLQFDLDEYDLQTPATPEGYKPYQLQTTALIGDDRNKRMFEAMPEGTETMIYASAEYEFVDVTSIWGSWIPFYPKTAALKANVRLTMLDNQLNEVLDVSREARSSRTVVMAGTATLEPSKLEPMAIDATNRAMDKLSNYLRGKV